MEIPIKSMTNTSSLSIIKKIGSILFKPFTEDNTIVNKTSFIMPMKQLKQILKNHYINQQPLLIIYEYYNEKNELIQHSTIAQIHSVIDNDQNIIVRDWTVQDEVALNLNQILTVSANMV